MSLTLRTVGRDGGAGIKIQGAGGVDDVNGFTAKQVRKITGIEYSTLDYWVRTGLISPSLAEANGSGTRRLYSFFDLIAIKIAVLFRFNGASLEMLRAIVTYLKNSGEQIVYPPAGSVLITDGRKMFEMAVDPEKILGLLSGQQLVWVVALDKVVNRLRKKIGVPERWQNGN